MTSATGIPELKAPTMTTEVERVKSAIKSHSVVGVAFPDSCCTVYRVQISGTTTVVGGDHSTIEEAEDFCDTLNAQAAINAMDAPSAVTELLADRIAAMKPPADPHTDPWTLGFCRARKMAGDIARKHGWSEAELAAIAELCAEKDLSQMQLLRCALRHYQGDEFKRKAGETCTWSGDAQRAADFAGPLAKLAPSLQLQSSEAVERAIRDHEREHGPSGDAWNISSILARLRTQKDIDQ